MKTNLVQPIICVVGLGYVGLPLAEAFSNHFHVIGYDIDKKRVKELKLHHSNQNILFINNPKQIKLANVIIIAVPTPITKSKQPDLSYIINATKIVASNMRTGCIVSLESTVYPGVTEEIVKPILEKSGLQCCKDFKLAYCPERINPGDTSHTIDKITKVVSGMDEETTDTVAQIYAKISPSIFKAKSIRTAEAAKVIENIQRDLNISLVNELSIIFQLIGLNTKDVLEAANTKWNFHRYSPGLVGGHCIPVDPYYLVHKSEESGYHPQVILAGRTINDYMPKHVANMTVRALNDFDKKIKGSHALIMGVAYKENVPDIRETPVVDLIRELQSYGIKITALDPLVNNIKAKFGIDAILHLDQLEKIDCLILAVYHDNFRSITLDMIRKVMNDNPILIDIRGVFDKEEATSAGFHYITL